MIYSGTMAARCRAKNVQNNSETLSLGVQGRGLLGGEGSEEYASRTRGLDERGLSPGKQSRGQQALVGSGGRMERLLFVSDGETWGLLVVAVELPIGAGVTLRDDMSQ